MGQVQATTDKEVTLQNIQELYRKFTSECPSGNLHLHEFKKIFGVSSKSTEEEVAFIELVFRSFDTNQVTCLLVRKMFLGCFRTVIHSGSLSRFCLGR